jgi:hypothetical protein
VSCVIRPLGVQLSPLEKRLLRSYWGATYRAVRIRRDGTVEAQRAAGEAWGVVETPQQARRSANILVNIYKRSKWIARQSR